MRRQDEENKTLRDEVEKGTQRERDLSARFREQEHRYTDLESKVFIHFYLFNA